MNLKIRDAHDEDAMVLAAFLRPEDEQEVDAAGFEDGLDALRFSLERSDVCYVAEIDGEPVAMWGLRSDSLVGQTGAPWLLTGSGIEAHRLTFMRVARVMLDEFLDRCPRGLHVRIDAEYSRALRWAKAMGFELSEPLPHPTTGRPFVQAIARRD